MIYANRALFVAFFAVSFFFVVEVQCQRIFRATLDGAQEVTPVASTTATGTGLVVLNAAETSIDVSVSFSGLSSNQTAGHIHGDAPRGAASGVVFNVGSTGTTSGTFNFTQAVSPVQVASLKAGLWYFNIHSTGFPGGEIRGQIESDCANLPSGLVSWYQGEGNAFDQNGIANGTLQNGASITNGLSGRAFNLDGIDDRVLLGNPAGFQTQDFTIEGWIRRSSNTVVSNNPFPGFDQGLLFSYGTGGYGLAIDRVTGRLLLTKIDDSQILSPALSITDTNFHHVAVTKSGNTVTFYVDGVGAMPVTYGTTFTFGTNAALGRRGDANSFNTFFGVIDEMSIYGSPLSATQIASIYNAGAAGKCPPCVATPIGLAEWWTGDGDLFGTRNRNNLAFFGGATFAEGISGNGFRFGTTGAGSAEAPDSSSLDVTTAFSFGAWINPAIPHNGLSQGAVISKIGGLAGNNGYQFGVTANNTQIFCQFNAMGEPWPTNQLIANVPAGGLPLNTWSHIACTYDNSSLRIYLDGVEIGSQFVGSKTVVNSSAPLRISGDSNLNVFFYGGIDEPYVIGRALSATEIATVVNAGRSCFCKPGPTTPPANLVGWWGGDGDALDLFGSNNGTLQNGTGFSIGRVGQSFSFDGVNDYVQTDLDIQPSAMPSVTFEAWVFPRSATGFDQAIISGDDGGWDRQIGISPSGTSFRAQTGTATTFDAGTVDYNQWQHIAVVYTPSDVKIYKNGVEFSFGSAPTGQASLNRLALGSNRCPPCVMGSQTQQFNGLIDEASVYDRALSLAEIRSIYNASLGGKLKQRTVVGTPPLSGNKIGAEAGFIQAKVGEATVTFLSVVGNGTVQLVPLSGAKLPTMPTIPQGLVFDISTNAQYFGPVTVCLNLPSFSPAQFSSLKFYHLEKGSWIDRTNTGSTYPNLCTTSLTSLSPFALGNLNPNAAQVSVGGRVMTPQGNGLSRAEVTLTGNDGNTRRVRTSSFGYFRFDDVLAGQTYVVVINSKRYTFTPRTITVDSEITDLDLVAID